MQKQKKNLSFKYGKYLYKRTFLLIRHRRFNKLICKTTRRKKSNSILYQALQSERNSLTVLFLRVKVVTNNVFCYLLDCKTKSTLISGSAGLYNINVSKKSMRFYARNVLAQFFSSCEHFIKKRKILLVFNVESRSRLKKKLVRVIRNYFKRKVIVIAAFKSRKCFNGCRQRKQVRRKRRFFRVFKAVA